MLVLTAEQRKQRMNELRQAHFHVGFDTSIYLSDYKINYIERSIAGQSKHAVSSQVLRKTNYQLGDDQNIYSTTSKDTFKPYQNTEKAKLSEETKSDLRSHHFQLGFHGDGQPSEYKRNYLEQGQVEHLSKLDQIEKCNQLRKHNHEFGDTNSYFSSMYNELHSNNYNPEFLKQAQSKFQTRQQSLKLRQTNMILGKPNPQQYITQNQVGLAPRVADPNKFNQDTMALLKGDHFEFGTDNADFSTEAKHQFKNYHNPSVPSAISKAAAIELRKTHFKVGNDKQDYTTTSNACFKMPLLNSSNLNNPQFQKNNFQIGDQRDPTDYTSYYKLHHSGKEAQKVEPMPNYTSSVQMGDDVVQDRFITEHTKNFQLIQQPPIKVTQEQKNALRKHNYDLGVDNLDWQTEAGSSFPAKKDAKPGQLDPLMKKDLRSHHFKLGDQERDYFHHQQHIGSILGEANKLDPEKTKDLRKHHFDVGNNQIDYRTTHKALVEGNHLSPLDYS